MIAGENELILEAYYETKNLEVNFDKLEVMVIIKGGGIG